MRMRGTFLIGCLSLIGAACQSETTFVSKVPLPLHEARPVFPAELGDGPAKAVESLKCALWTFRRGPRGTLSEIGCKGYRLEALEADGDLYLAFRQGKLWFGAWEKAGTWDERELVQSAERLNELIRARYAEPQYSNVDRSLEVSAAILRGEYHQRWNLGNGLFYLWVGKDEFGRHTLVVQIREKKQRP
jgi:hypothetical protein